MLDLILEQKISFYKNVFSKVTTAQIQIGSIFNAIRDGVYKDKVDNVRSEKDKKKRQELKRKIPCFTPSGIFMKGDRSDDSLVSDFTSVIVLDLDKKENKCKNLDSIPAEAMCIPTTLAVHKSVGGEGYAVYVLVDRWAKNTYSFAKLYYEILLDVDFDKATSNLSRLRYISYDPDILINENCRLMKIPPVPAKPKSKRPHNTSGNDSINGIWRLAKRVIEAGTDPTSNYDDWFRIGVALAGNYGEDGRELFHYISSNYDGYSFDETEKKYSYFLGLTGYSVTEGTVVYILSQFQ